MIIGVKVFPRDELTDYPIQMASPKTIHIGIISHTEQVVFMNIYAYMLITTINKNEL